MDQQRKETSEGIKEVNEGTYVDAGSLEKAVENVQAAREESEEGAKEKVRGPVADALDRVVYYGQVMEGCLHEAGVITSDVTKQREIMLAIFNRATEGEERRKFTALFERAIKWYTDREDKLKEDAEASRAAFTAIVPPKLVERDPVMAGLRSTVNSLLDIAEAGTRSKGVDELLSFTEQVNETLAERSHDLVLWLKMRQLGSKRRAAAAAQIEDQQDMAHHLGRAVAYEDAWRQGIWPGKAVEDGTLDEDEFKSVDLTWRKKAADVDAKIMSDEITSRAVTDRLSALVKDAEGRPDGRKDHG